MAKDPSIERPRFDVFGMMLILTFLMTGGASWLLYDRLTDSWGYKLFSDPPPVQKWHLTEFRDLNKNYQVKYADLRKIDLDEWKSIPGTGGTFPVSGYEWPADYKVNEYPVFPDQNTWLRTEPNIKDVTKKSEEAQKWLAQLKLLAPGIDSDTPAPAPGTPPAPKEEPKKEDAPKADAPKADAPKADAPKADAPKPDAEKK